MGAIKKSTPAKTQKVQKVQKKLYVKKSNSQIYKKIQQGHKKNGLKEGHEFIRINNVFPDIIRNKGIDLFSKIPSSEYISVYYQGNYKVKFNKKYGFDKKIFVSQLSLQDNTLKNMFVLALKKIAKKLKLSKEYGIYSQIHTYYLKSDIPYEQQWHYDGKSLYTCVIELYNDFPVRYLDISRNFSKMKKFPPNPHFLDDNYFIPGKKIKQIKYNDNEMICFPMYKGKLIHRVNIRPLKFRQKYTKKRTIMAIVIKDDEWNA
jgi:hypothetical protein